MKTDYKLVALGAFLGLVIWFFCGSSEWLMFQFGSLFGKPSSNHPVFELIMRGVILVCFLGFGMAAARGVAKARTTEKRLRDLNAALLGFRKVSQVITKEKSRDQLVRKACENMVRYLGFQRVWIALLDKENKLDIFSRAGFNEEMWAPVFDSLLKQALPACVQKTMEHAGPLVIKNPSQECGGCPLAASHGSRGIVCRRLSSDGHVYGMLALSISPRLLGDKKLLELVEEIADDISLALDRLSLEEKQIQTLKKIRENEAMLQSILRSAPVGIGLVSDRNILWINDKMVEMTGYSKEELVGHNSRVVYLKLNS